MRPTPHARAVARQLQQEARRRTSLLQRLAAQVRGEAAEDDEERPTEVVAPSFRRAERG